MYRCYWETKVGVGCSYYSGIETIEAEDSDEAIELAQRKVWQTSFRNFPSSHIKVYRVQSL